MQLIDKYLDDIQHFNLDEFSFVTYEMYCEALDLSITQEITNEFFYNNISEGLFTNIRKMKLSRDLVKTFRDLKSGLEKIAKEFKLELPTLVTAFKQKDVFGVLKAFGFNIKLMLRAIQQATKALRGGLLSVFKELHKQKVFQQLEKGAIKIDDVLKRWPLLTKISGVVVAGLLIYIWLNMTFIGDLDYDFNFTDIANALKGSFSIATLFASPEGLMLITLFGSGVGLGLSFPWLGKSLYNLVVAIIYTGIAQTKHKDKSFKDVLKRFKREIKKGRPI